MIDIKSSLYVEGIGDRSGGRVRSTVMAIRSCKYLAACILNISWKVKLYYILFDRELTFFIRTGLYDRELNFYINLPISTNMAPSKICSGILE